MAEIQLGHISTPGSEAAQILDLERHLDRKPRRTGPAGSASGSRSARAIVRNPKAFLVKEPLSNLGAELRLQMRTDVARMQRSLRTTMMYVKRARPKR